MTNILFLFVNLYLILPLKGESIFNNPYKSNKEFNPINYKIILSISAENENENKNKNNQTSVTKVDKMTTIDKGSLSVSAHNIPINKTIPILENLARDEISINKVLQHYDRLIYNSFALSPNFFAFIGDSKTIYFILENKLYKINKNDEQIFPAKVEIEINSTFLFIDYINRKFTNVNEKKQIVGVREETIIYGMIDKKIFFYNIASKKLIYSELKEIDVYTSCKFIIDNYFICIYSEKDEIKLSILNNTNNNHMETLHTYNESSNIFFTEINEPILYDTDSNELKILCGRKKDNNDTIKCILVSLTISQKDERKEAFGIKFDNISTINATFSFKENNCNYAMFNSEYLFCCGKENIIICERWDKELQFISKFNLILNGNIRNLTIENHNNSYVELLYHNEALEPNNIYEHRIYPPKCTDIIISSFNNKSSSIGLDNLFERKTNTKYYISLDTISNENFKYYINENDINNSWEKIELKDMNYFKYELRNIKEIKNIEINYNISIEETYSEVCTISIVFCILLSFL